MPQETGRPKRGNQLVLGKKAKRQKQILDMIEISGFETIETLARILEVSEQTVRRDIAELDESNAARRTHGGVAILNNLSTTDYIGRRYAANPIKQKLAERVATLVKNSDSVFLDAGTTCEHVALALRNHKGLRVVTYNLSAANILKDCEDFMVAVPGGFVRHIDGSIMGDFSENFLERFNFDVAVLSVSGIDESGILGDDNNWEVANAQAAMRRTAKTILVAHSRKFGQTGFVQLGHLSDVDYLVTEELPPRPLKTIIEESTEVFLA